MHSRNRNRTDPYVSLRMRQIVPIDRTRMTEKEIKEADQIQQELVGFIFVTKILAKVKNLRFKNQVNQGTENHHQFETYKKTYPDKFPPGTLDIIVPSVEHATVKKIIADARGQTLDAFVLECDKHDVAIHFSKNKQVSVKDTQGNILLSADLAEFEPITEVCMNEYLDEPSDMNFDSEESVSEEGDLMFTPKNTGHNRAVCEHFRQQLQGIEDPKTIQWFNFFGQNELNLNLNSSLVREWKLN